MYMYIFECIYTHTHTNTHLFMYICAFVCVYELVLLQYTNVRVYIGLHLHSLQLVAFNGHFGRRLAMPKKFVSLGIHGQRRHGRVAARASQDIHNTVLGRVQNFNTLHGVFGGGGIRAV